MTLYSYENGKGSKKSSHGHRKHHYPDASAPGAEIAALHQSFFDAALKYPYNDSQILHDLQKAIYQGEKMSLAQNQRPNHK